MQFSQVPVDSSHVLKSSQTASSVLLVNHSHPADSWQDSRHPAGLSSCKTPNNWPTHSPGT